jgi:hypothetical protein
LFDRHSSDTTDKFKFPIPDAENPLPYSLLFVPFDPSAGSGESSSGRRLISYFNWCFRAAAPTEVRSFDTENTENTENLFNFPVPDAENPLPHSLLFVPYFLFQLVF